tara:strand:+ start:176 stop:460 length:285 start_codon:yes stop_codon:yes gene_type:complete
MTNEPNIKGCLTRAIEALESVEDLRDAMQIVGVWPKGLSISNVERSLADLKAFVAALPEEKRRSEVNSDWEYMAEQDNYLCGTTELLQEAISDE